MFCKIRSKTYYEEEIFFEIKSERGLHSLATMKEVQKIRTISRRSESCDNGSQWKSKFWNIYE